MMKSRKPLVMVGISLGWLALTVGLVRLGEGGFALWRKQVAELQRARAELARLKGWISVEENLIQRRGELLGTWASLPKESLSWATLEGLQELAKGSGLFVQELRPSRVAGRGGEPTLFRLDLNIKGELSGLSTFLKRVPETIPGIQLENLRLTPCEGSQVQGLFRLSVAE